MNTIINIILAFAIVFSYAPYTLVEYENWPVGEYSVNHSEYSFDASGYYDCYYDEAERLVGISENFDTVVLEYCTYYELGFDGREAYEAHIPSAGNDWEMAYASVDIYYGLGTYIGMNSAGYVPESIDPCIYPACALFSAALSSDIYTTPTFIYGALLVDEEGILFIEAYTYNTDPEYGKALIYSVLNRVTRSGESIVLSEPHTDAPAELTAVYSGSTDIGGGFVYNSVSHNMHITDSASEEYGDMPEFIVHSFFYPDGQVQCTYLPYEHYSTTRQRLEAIYTGSNAESAIADYCYNCFCTFQTDLGYMSNFKRLSSGSFGDYAYVRFSSVQHAYGFESPVESLLITGEYGFMIFSFISSTEGITADESCVCFDRYLEGLLFEGSPIVIE